MITFIILFAIVILAFAGWMIAKGAGKDKRSRMADDVHVTAQQTGAGSPTVGRASGNN